MNGGYPQLGFTLGYESPRCGSRFVKGRDAENVALPSLCASTESKNCQSKMTKPHNQLYSSCEDHSMLVFFGIDDLKFVKSQIPEPAR